MTPPADLIPIDEAARILRRSLDTLRNWSAAGRAPNGMRLGTWRDGLTKVRYFRRSEVDRIASALLQPAA